MKIKSKNLTQKKDVFVNLAVMLKIKAQKPHIKKLIFKNITTTLKDITIIAHPPSPLPSWVEMTPQNPPPSDRCPPAIVTIMQGGVGRDQAVGRRGSARRQ